MSPISASKAPLTVGENRVVTSAGRVAVLSAGQVVATLCSEPWTETVRSAAR